jgi:HAD superfamily hydrolase (TIGR01509 family)
MYFVMRVTFFFPILAIAGDNTYAEEPVKAKIGMKPESGWQLAIFDCDGVLVDSEGLTHESLAEALGELGIELDIDSAIGHFMGNSLPQSIAIIEQMLGKPLPDNFFPDWREKLYARLRSAPVKAIPGIEDMLDTLDMPYCVVSNGPVRKMQTTLGVTGLLERFDGRIYSSESGLPGKPAPDLFLKAARDFNARPDSTFVVEDSVKGATGAVAAGMRVFGYAAADYIDADELAAVGATVFTDMRELPSLIRS